MSVLITGANGRTSRHVISALLATQPCPPLRLLVHSQSSKGALGSTFPQILSSPHSIIIADYLEPRTLSIAFKGISVVFHNGPAFHPLESVMGVAVIDAAMESSDRPHFVFCSVLHPFRTKLLNHRSKLTIEEYLVESKLDYTILQPTHYMQNAPLASIVRTGILPLGHSSSTKHGFLDLADLAEVARAVIVSPRSHNRASYELVGQNMAYSAVAKIMEAEIGKPIKCGVLLARDFAMMLLSSGTTQVEFSEDAAERMIVYYDRWGLIGNPNTLEWLLGRVPSNWRQYLARELAN